MNAERIHRGEFVGSGVTVESDCGQIDTVRALLHDLRGPVATIRLLSDVRSAPDRQLREIAEQAGWLADLIESTLAGGGGDQLDAVDVCRSVTTAVDLWRRAAPCDLTMQLPSAAWAWARPVAIVRALGCLIDNAVRAAAVGGHVVARVEDDECRGLVRVSIIDDGPGPGRIPARTSLGLATTRALVAACNGGFALRRGPHGGAVAEICLDRAVPQRAAG